MLTATITNLSTTVAIGPGTATSARYTDEFATSIPVILPGAFSWLNIAAGGTVNVTPTCRVQDLLASAVPHGGFTVGDVLQQMVQLGQISVSFANLAATMENDVSGDAVANET